VSRRGPIRIQGERVTLRPLRVDEVEASLCARRRLHESDPAAVPSVPAGEVLRERFANSGVMRDGATDLAIEVGGRRIGEIQTYVPPDRVLPPGAYEVGIMIDDPADRGHGIGTEATRLMLDWLFTEHEASGVNMPTAEGNTPMRTVLHRLGFVVNGTAHAFGQEFLLYTLTRRRWLDGYAASAQSP
jgi:RimJ/RimL family protein N-acetyltransferase